MKKLFRKVLAIMLAVTVTAQTINLNALAHESEGEADILTEQSVSNGDVEDVLDLYTTSSGDLVKPVTENGWDGVTTQEVFEGDGYRVTYTLTGYWDGGYNAIVNIENTGVVDIQNWRLDFDYQGEVFDVWNSDIEFCENGKCRIKNVGWNQDIEVDKAIEFGICGSESFLGFPTGYNLLSNNVEHRAEEFIIDYHVESDWGTGFAGIIDITNNTENAIEDWGIVFEFDRSIVSIWNALLELQEDNYYTIKNAGYNANIAPGQTVTFGFIGEGGDASDIPYNYHLSSFQPDSTEYVQLEDGKIDKMYLFKAIYPYLILHGIDTENVKLADDYDGDGLTLAEEYDYDTNPFSKDTDEDGLEDYAEIFEYETNPIKYDTDEDGMSDGTEISCGLDPLVRDTDGDGISDHEEMTCQNVRIYSVETYSLDQTKTLPMVQMTGKGDYSQKIYAMAVENNEAISDIDCMVGTAFDFVHDDNLEFESSTLSFVISRDVLSKYALSDLAIAWYNEETNTLELMDTSVDAHNNIIYTHPEHYSTYMVVSVPDYLYTIDWENEGSIIESGKADIVFVVDTTGSMSNAINNVKNNITTFVSNLENNKVDVRLGLVEYKDIYADGVESTKCYGWYTNVAQFRQQLGGLRVSGGGGDGPESAVDALYCARNMKFRTGVKKYIILVTDANYNNGTANNKDTTLTDEIKNLCSDQISVSVVTAPYYYNTYDSLTVQTDGLHANLNDNFATALKALIDKIGSIVNQGCWIRLANGSVICLDKDPSLGDETTDTDGDGIPDVQELESVCKVNFKNPYTGKIQAVDVWTFYSNPSKKDTDGDGIEDLEDPRKTIFDVWIVQKTDELIQFNTGRIWYNIPCTSYDYLDNMLQVVDLHADNPIPLDELKVIAEKVAQNDKQRYTLDELAVIGIYNNEGSKLYMHNCTEKTRESVFQKIAGRESKYCRHSGILWDEGWNVVPKGTESGFFKGAVLSEADINFSWKIYTVCDIYKVLTVLVQIGVIVVAVIVVTEVTAVIAINLEALLIYISKYGVVVGFQLFMSLGPEGATNSVISVLQTDMADGDSSLDDIVEGGTSTLAQYGDDFGKMGTYVENPNIKVDWTQYAEHAAERMQQRGMTQEMVNNIVENGKVLSQNNGNKFAYITQEGVAIVSKEGKLITAWSSTDFDSSMSEIISKLFGE